MTNPTLPQSPVCIPNGRDWTEAFTTKLLVKLYRPDTPVMSELCLYLHRAVADLKRSGDNHGGAMIMIDNHARLLLKHLAATTKPKLKPRPATKSEPSGTTTLVTAI